MYRAHNDTVLVLISRVLLQLLIIKVEHKTPCWPPTTPVYVLKRQKTTRVASLLGFSINPNSLELAKRFGTRQWSTTGNWWVPQRCTIHAHLEQITSRTFCLIKLFPNQRPAKYHPLPIVQAFVHIKQIWCLRWMSSGNRPRCRDLSNCWWVSRLKLQPPLIRFRLI